MDAKRRAIADATTGLPTIPPLEEHKSLTTVDSAEEKRKTGPHDDDHDDAADVKRRAIAHATTGFPTVPPTETEELSYSDEECLRLNKIMDDYANEGIVVVFYSKIGDFSVDKFVVCEDAANVDATTPLTELLTKFFIADSESHMRAFDLIKKEILSCEQKMSECNYDGHGKMIRAEIELNEDGSFCSVFLDEHTC